MLKYKNNAKIREPLFLPLLFLKNALFLGGKLKKTPCIKAPLATACHQCTAVVTICGDEGHKDVIRDRKQLLSWGLQDPLPYGPGGILGPRDQSVVH